VPNPAASVPREMIAHVGDVVVQMSALLPHFEALQVGAWQDAAAAEVVLAVIGAIDNLSESLDALALDVIRYASRPDAACNLADAGVPS
jgi:hypothetical protein